MYIKIYIWGSFYYSLVQIMILKDDCAAGSLLRCYCNYYLSETFYRIWKYYIHKLMYFVCVIYIYSIFLPQPKSEADLDCVNAVFVPEKIGNPHGLQITFFKGGSTRNLYVYSNNSKVILQNYFSKYLVIIILGWVPL